jgi:hypothetical protein
MTGRFRAARSEQTLSAEGRFEPVTLRGSNRSRRKPEALRDRGRLYLDWLTPKPPSAAGANVNLMALTGGAPAVGYRQQPLHSRHKGR